MYVATRTISIPCRFVATVYPLSSYLQHPDDKQTRAKVKLAAAWVTGVLLWLPAILYFRYVHHWSPVVAPCLSSPFHEKGDVDTSEISQTQPSVAVPGFRFLTKCRAFQSRCVDESPVECWEKKNSRVFQETCTRTCTNEFLCRHVEGGDLHSGECLFVPNLVFTVVQASVVYYLPMLVIGYFYGRVVHILYFRKLSLGGSTKDSRAPGCAGASKVSEGNTLDMRSDGNLKDGVGGKFKRQHFKARDFQKDKTADVMSSLRGSDSNGQVCKEPKSNNHSLVYYNSNFENKVSADRESSETKQLPGVQNEASLQDVVLADGTKTESRQVRFPRRLDICLVEREARTLRHVSWSVKQLRNTASGGVTRGAGVHGSRHGRRVTLTLGVVIAAYLVCWLPFTVAWPVHAFCRCLPAQFYDFTYWAAYINSTLNPFLYFLLNRDFRRALQRFRARCWRRGARDVCSNIHDFSSSCRC